MIKRVPNFGRKRKVKCMRCKEYYWEYYGDCRYGSSIICPACQSKIIKSGFETAMKIGGALLKKLKKK